MISFTQSLSPFYENTDKTEQELLVKVINDQLILNFKFEPPFYTNKNFSSESSNWSLWDYDVFEVFLQQREHEHDYNAPYLEFQVSPLGQYFLLKIHKKRELYCSLLSNPFTFKTTCDTNWRGTIQYQLEASAKLTYFNASAILGPKDKRNFYAASGDFKRSADFHCPELFKPLIP